MARDPFQDKADDILLGPIPGSIIPPEFLVVPPAGYVSLWYTLPSDNRVLAMLMSPFKVDGGYATYSDVQRPRKKTITEYAGQDPVTVTFSIIFDRWQSGKSVEPDVQSLEKFAQPYKRQSPPSAHLLAEGLPRVAKKVTSWIVTGLEWGDMVEYNKNNVRCRQDATLTLREEPEDPILVTDAAPKGKPKKNVDCKKAKSKVKVYTWKKDDTIQKVSQKFLGSSKCIKQILDLNKIHNPKTIKVGDKIKLPT